MMWGNGTLLIPADWSAKNRNRATPQPFVFLFKWFFRGKYSRPCLKRLYSWVTLEILVPNTEQLHL